MWQRQGVQTLVHCLTRGIISSKMKFLSGRGDRVKVRLVKNKAATLVEKCLASALVKLKKS